jgi:hypothetical protein
MNSHWNALAVTVLMAPSLAGQAGRPIHDGRIALFGGMHHHSALSDDVPAADRPRMSPVQAWDYARTHGLDFLALTDHHKATDAPGNPLRLTAAEYEDQLFGAARDYCNQHAGAFVAIPGVEWGNSATGNHVNVFGAPTLPPDSIANREYDELYAWADLSAEFLQLNHPYAWGNDSNRDTSVGNFGEALYPSSGAFADALNTRGRLMSVITTVRGGHLSGEFRHDERKTHRDTHPEALAEWLRFLNLGCHFSPSANQDTHWTNWGTVTAARTGVWADTFTYRGVMDAFRAGRVFATEDDELAVALQVRVAGRTYWMGEFVPLPADEADVDLVVFIDQAAGTDGDPTGEGLYSVAIYSDGDGVGGREAAIWDSITVPQGVAHVVRAPVRAGEYLFLRVQERGGRDNPIGDGLDEWNAATGTEEPDELRDSLNDVAWASPVWFTSETPSVTFVWSVNSGLFHDSHCWAVARIGAANRREGTDPGARTKHACSGGQ